MPASAADATEVEGRESRSTAPGGTNTIQFTQKMLFYNPGPQFRDTLRYDSPFKMVHESKMAETVQGMIAICAEAQDFFTVPVSVTIVNEESGLEETASLSGIYARVMTQLRERGVVLVEKDRHRSRKGDPNVADTKDAARKLGDDLHDQYIRAMAGEWMRIVAEAKAMHAVPQRATGLYAYALKRLHIADPAADIDVIEHERKGVAGQKETNAEVATLREQLAELRGMLMARNTTAEVAK